MRKLCKLIPLLVILTLVWGVNLSYGDIVAGVEGGSLPEATLEEAPAGEILEASVQATVIDFDDSAEPCGFSETTALRNKYSAQGVVFSGPAALDGGAILNECSFFAVTGHSPPNFLAFNINGFMFDGGIPRGPETLVFDPPVSYVQVNAGDGVDPGTVTMYAYQGSTLVDTDTITGGSALQTMRVDGNCIDRVVITFTGTRLVLDDLAFEPCQQDCDYCLLDSGSGLWCLNVETTTFMGLTLSGTYTAGNLYEALAIYLSQPVPPTLAMTGANFDDPWFFMFNLRFLSDTLARGRWISRVGASGDVDVEIVDCGSGISAIPESSSSPWLEAD